MTVNDVRDMLLNYPGNAVVIFEPRYFTTGGLPRWVGATIVAETQYDMNDDLVPTGRVLIRLEDMEE